MKSKAILNIRGVVILALVLSLGLPSLAAAAWSAAAGVHGDQPQAVFMVNDEGDTPDGNLGDGVCADSMGKCTLRAALEEAGAGGGGDTIIFASPMHIQVGSPLPIISRPTTVIDASGVWDTVNDAPGVLLDGVDRSFVGLGLNGSFGIVRGLHIVNFQYGIRLTSGYNQIGGTAQGQRNIISLNEAGIFIYDSDAHDNKVQGNWIGLSAQGDTADPNVSNGIFITGGAAHNTIGGNTPAEGNYISGNGLDGVWIMNTGCDGTRLGGNVIGRGADDQTPLGNERHGVFVSGGPQDTWIGGDGLAANDITSNVEHGIAVTFAPSTTIQGNLILDNQCHGVYLWDSDNTRIAANTIVLNALDGVHILGSSALHNLVTANSIFDDGGLGINLQDGGNGELPAPTISIAAPDGASGTACPGCTVEIYSDDSDEGHTYHGFVNADGSGNWTYTGTISGPNATATNRDSQNNTSEFSAPVSVTLPCTPLGGVAISGPTEGQPGLDICFSATAAPPDASPPLAYAWSPDALASGQGTAAACYNWTQPGTHVITATSSNCNGAGMAADTHTVTISADCIPVTGAAIVGPGSGLVGLLYGYSAVVTPTGATPPISYVWTPLPGSGQGSANVQYTWAAAGQYGLQLTVSNCGGAGTASDDHAITISGAAVYWVYLPTVTR